jgi:hypothetical protein
LAQLETFANELGVNPGALKNILRSLLTVSLLYCILICV